MQYYLLENVWLVVFLWGVVYLSDYYLTLYSARLFQNGLGNHIRMQGSFELTPVFQRDIDRLNPVSRAFFVRWLFSLMFIPAVMWVSYNLIGDGRIYFFLLGGLFLREAAIHLRHLRNINLAKLSAQPGSIRGRVEYSRWLMLRTSATELWSFAALFLIFALTLGSWFFFGGASITAITGAQHWSMARKHAPALPEAQPTA